MKNYLKLLSFSVVLLLICSVGYSHERSWFEPPTIKTEKSFSVDVLFQFDADSYVQIPSIFLETEAPVLEFEKPSEDLQAWQKENKSYQRLHSLKAVRIAKAPDVDKRQTLFKVPARLE